MDPKPIKPAQRSTRIQKRCFVTIGATAKFEELLQAVLARNVMEKLAEKGFTSLVLQCGDSLSYCEEIKPKEIFGLTVDSFKFRQDGLGEEIRACRHVEGVSEQGLVISHAGSGTILDVMRMGVPLIVVPNPKLLDNHQQELADELERQGYVTSASIDNLAAAIEKASILMRVPWGHENKIQGAAPIIDQVCGYNSVLNDEEVRETELKMELD